MDGDQVIAPIYAGAARALRHARSPLDAELQVSSILGMVRMMMYSSVPPKDRDATLASFCRQLIDFAERQRTPTALGLLRAISVIARKPSGALAEAAATRLAYHGVREPEWTANIGLPSVERCWRYSSAGSGQESVTITFAYGTHKHALSILVDHLMGGGIKDCWTSDDPGSVWQRTLAVVGREPQAVVEDISIHQARAIVRKAIAEEVCPVDDEQEQDVDRFIALVHSRLGLLNRLALVSDKARQRVENAARRAIEDAEPPTHLRGPATVLQMRATLRGHSPQVWRRLEVPLDLTLADLHPALVIAFGWDDVTGHRFESGGVSYGAADFDSDFSDEHGVRLTKVAPFGSRLRYCYDTAGHPAGELVIDLEKLLPSTAGAHYPRCSAGRRNATAPELFDLEPFDSAEANAALAELGVLMAEAARDAHAAAEAEAERAAEAAEAAELAAHLWVGA